VPIPLFRVAILAASLLAASSAFADGLDDAVLAELNFARERPADYARDLMRSADPERYSSFANEDPDALEEAIDFLERQPALPPLQRDARITAAAREYARAQGARGDVGHGPAGSLGERLRQNGVWAGLVAENISYGQDKPRDIVRQLIVDSRVASRGHRRNIFTGAYRSAGVACGPHRAYGAMCVIDFASAIAQR
jgi:uncharacterized protein YkwD